MQRFWIFPLVLAIVAAPFPQLTFLEALFPMVVLEGHFPTVRTALSDLGEIWNLAGLYSVVIGAVLGIGLAFFDLFHHRGRPHSGLDSASALFANLWWCGVYVTAISALNALFALVIIRILSAPAPRSLIVFLPWVLVAVLNLSAILWASIRTITTTDVLSPAVLSRKLKRSTRIEG